MERHNKGVENKYKNNFPAEEKKEDDKRSLTSFTLIGIIRHSYC